MPQQNDHLAVVVRLLNFADTASNEYLAQHVRFLVRAYQEWIGILTLEIRAVANQYACAELLQIVAIEEEEGVR